MSHIGVYLVEDQALIRECLRAMLDLEPNLEVVGDSAEAERALQELNNLDVDVVLMDIKLPGLNGIEATRRLKENHPDLPVVMLTSYQDEYLAAAFEVGANGYILKSCTTQQLVQAIRAALEGQTPVDSTLTSNLICEIAELRKAHRESLLNPRQVEILELVASGTRYREIAHFTSLSPTTVKREMRDVFNRLGVNDAAHAVSEAYKKGLL